jgi:hypothetical protein
MFILEGIAETLLTYILWLVMLLPLIVLVTPVVLLLGAFRTGYYFRDVKDLYCGIALWWIHIGGEII